MYIYEDFSATCKRYTDVMAQKNELQRLIFTKNNNIQSSLIHNITDIVIYLEDAALKLQDIAVR